MLRGVEFVFERFDLGAQGFVFGHLALQKAAGEGHFFCDARGREDVHVFEFVFAVLEVAELDQAFVGQCFDAVIDFAVADAQNFGQVALGDVGPVLQLFEHPKIQVFAVLDLFAGHVACRGRRRQLWGRLPHGRVVWAAYGWGAHPLRFAGGKALKTRDLSKFGHCRVIFVLNDKIDIFKDLKLILVLLVYLN